MSDTTGYILVIIFVAVLEASWLISKWIDRKYPKQHPLANHPAVSQSRPRDLGPR